MPWSVLSVTVVLTWRSRSPARRSSKLRSSASTPHGLVRAAKPRAAGWQRGVGEELLRARRTVRGVPRWAGLGIGQPYDGGVAGDHRRDGEAGAYRARPGGLLASDYALFTQPPRRGITRTSPVRGSRKFVGRNY